MEPAASTSRSAARSADGPGPARATARQSANGSPDVWTDRRPRRGRARPGVAAPARELHEELRHAASVPADPTASRQRRRTGAVWRIDTWPATRRYRAPTSTTGSRGTTSPGRPRDRAPVLLALSDRTLAAPDTRRHLVLVSRRHSARGWLGSYLMSLMMLNIGR